MQETNKQPLIYKRTKIIATVGPATDSYEKICKLITAGANGLRLNFSHGDHAEHGRRIKWIREASKEYGKPVAIIQDLQGPKIRLGDFEGSIDVKAGQTLTFEYQADYKKSGRIPTQYDLSAKVQPGERVYLFDGKVKTIVDKVKDGLVEVTVENDGSIVKRKGMNLPDTNFGGDVITEKDKADLAFGATQDIDYVAQSFVQTPDDVRSLRAIMKKHKMDAKIIAKFETKVALEHMEAIVRETDAIMIARGDLAVEVPAESVPVIQRRLIGLGMQYVRPTIVATQMMFSMTEALEPTRAEVSDVASATILGADCVMLSDETASGKYPLQAVASMKRVIMYTQAHVDVHPVVEPLAIDTHSAAISDAAVKLAEQLHADAIIAETKTGATAEHIAVHRPKRPIISVTSDPKVAQQLSLLYANKSFLRPDGETAGLELAKELVEQGFLTAGSTVILVSGRQPGLVGGTDTIRVRQLG